MSKKFIDEVIGTYKEYKDVCYQKWLDWLNAPAESEGEDE